MKAPVAPVLLLPLAVLGLALTTSGIIRSLSFQYLDALVVSLSITFAFSLLEWVLPSAGPRKHAAQMLLDIEVGILLFLAATVTGAFAGWVASIVGHHLDGRWLDLRFRSADNLPALVATVLLSWLIFDFFSYWYHRSEHTFAILWQVHKFHHMDEKVSVTSRLRDNLSDTFISIFFIAIPIAIFFKFDPVATAKLSLFMKLGTEAQGVFIHTNIRLHLGWASALMVGPQLHRIHHSRLTRHYNQNFCVYFPIWDILFGTYYHPSQAEFPPTGIDETRDVSSILEVLALPLQGWRDMFFGWRRRHTREDWPGGERPGDTEKTPA